MNLRFNSSFIGIFLFVFIFLITTSYALNASISCPSELSYEEIAECEVEVYNFQDFHYDLKIYIVGDDGGVNRIWDNDSDKWRRADWYLKKEIDKEGIYNAKILIYKEYLGEARGEFKLRDREGDIVVNDRFTVEIVEKSEEVEVVESSDEDIEEEEEVDDEEEILVVEEKNDDEEDSILSVEKKNVSKKIINLGSHEVLEEGEIIYVSKFERVKDYTIYGVFLFLICIIVYLLYARRW